MSDTTLTQRTQFFLEACDNHPVRPHTVYYHAYRTCIMSCSPLAIFQELIADEAFSDYEHVWVFGSDACFEYDTFKRYRDLPNIRFVRFESKEQAEALATCEYLITNAGLPTYWQKRPGQVVINTWHGTPMKALGKDARDFNGTSIGNAQRNFILSDYLVMPNKYTADRLWESYALEGLFHGKILDVGSPRIDAVFNADHARTRKLLEEKCGMSLEGKRVVLYAPTFRSEEGKSLNTSDVMAGYMAELVERCPDDCVFFFKVHNTLGRFFEGDVIMDGRLLFDEIETSELLGATDILITDYSSIFVDYLGTERPILFFVYDKDTYVHEHGMYRDISTMPGAECLTVDDVLARISEIEAGTYRNPNWQEAYREFAYNDDGGASKRAVDIMFRGLPASRGTVEDYTTGADDDGRERIMVSLSNESRLSELLTLTDYLETLNPEEHAVTIAAHDIHYIARECQRVFPEAGIVFADIESSRKHCAERIDDGFLAGQYRKFFGDMRVDRYVNLKQGEGFIDEMVGAAFPGAERLWMPSWDADVDAQSLVAASTHYAQTIITACHTDDVPASIADAGITVITDLDIRERPGHRSCALFVTSFDSTNYTLAACAAELAARGYRVLVSAINANDYINNRVFIDNDIDVFAARSIDSAALNNVDVVIGSPIKPNGLNQLYGYIAEHNLLVFSFLNLFSSVTMRINADFVFTLGEAKIEELAAYNLRYNCIPIGNPQYDALLPHRKEPGHPINRVLFIEQGGYPYGTTGKRQVAELLQRIARLNPDLEITVKPRYLPSDSKGLLHAISEHVYDYLADCPSNLHLMMERCSVEEAIEDNDAVMTMWSTAYLDAIVLGVPLLLVDGFDNIEVFDVRQQRVDEAYEHLRGTGCLHHVDEVGANLRDMFAYADAAYVAHEIYGVDSPAATRAADIIDHAYRHLVLPGKRIAEDFNLTAAAYPTAFEQLATVDADDMGYRAKKRYRESLNTALQEYVFINRCMGAVFDLSAFEQLRDADVPALQGAELDSYIKDQEAAFDAQYGEAVRAYFESDEGKRAVEHDAILQDYYFDWLYDQGRYDEIAHPSVRNLIAPESREYNLALVSLKRKKYLKAYNHLFAFLRATTDAPRVTLLKHKRVRYAVQPFREGKKRKLFIALLMKDENIRTAELAFDNPHKIPAVAWKRARDLYRSHAYRDCVVYCDKALLYQPAKTQKAAGMKAKLRLAFKKSIYRSIATTKQKALAAMK